MSSSLRAVLLASLLIPSAANAELVSPKRQKLRVSADTALTVDRIVDKIHRSYMPALRRCYNRGLKSDPTLGGTVTVTFTINAYGRVDGEAAGIAPKVDACLTTALGAWRFPTSNARKEATFRISLALSL